MRYAQVVLGPAGSGKTTYCRALQDYLLALNRRCYVVNLDPASEDCIAGGGANNATHFDTDIREVVDVNKIVAEEGLGPNGGLVRCAELFVAHLDWLVAEIEHSYPDESYLLFDTPGQIELYLHVPFVKSITRLLSRLSVNTVAVYLMDVSFMGDPAKLVSGALSGLAAMINLEVPHISVLSKCDLVSSGATAPGGDSAPGGGNWATGPGGDSAPGAMHDIASVLAGTGCPRPPPAALDAYLPPTYRRLNAAFSALLDDFSLISFIPLNIFDEESLQAIVVATDIALQFGEEAEPSARYDIV